MGMVMMVVGRVMMVVMMVVGTKIMVVEMVVALGLARVLGRWSQ